MRVHQLKALVLWCTEAKKALAFPKNSFSFSNSRTRRRNTAISASISRGSGRPCSAAWRRSRSSLTHRPTTVSPSPQSRATDAIDDPVSNTKDATSRRYSGVKRRRVPITGTSLSAGTHTRLTKCQQHKPKPKTELQWLEWQAHRLTPRVLMPKTTFTLAANQMLDTATDPTCSRA